MSDEAGSMVNPVDFSDVQGIVRFGYRKLTEASFLLLKVRSAEAARAWLRSAPISNAVERETAPVSALQVAFTRQGLERLGVPESVIAGFSTEFRAGMSEDAGRSRLLGDVGANAPEHWVWGGPKQVPDVLLMLYAQPGRLASWSDAVKGVAWDEAFEVDTGLSTSDLGGLEPFGFMDSLSQPALDWEERKLETDEQLTYSNLVSLGEVVLGYRNEYGRYTDRPMLKAGEALHSGLQPAAEQPGVRDLGHNGCYLVVRTLEQDVAGFWQFADASADGNPEAREALACSMVGRRRDGTPLARLSEDVIQGIDAEDAARNGFTFDSDVQGLRCPFGAHIRRANPRNADLPTPPAYGLEKALRVVGLGKHDLQSDAKASTRFHRILRRGREYGSGLTIEAALKERPGEGSRGIHFICLVANIARQFEFLQSAWLMSSKFDAMTDEGDPLLGNREPVAGARTDAFSRPHESGVRQRISGVPQFVTVRGGAYFFLPSLGAIRYVSRADAVQG